MANLAISQLPASAAAHASDLLAKDDQGVGPTQALPVSQILALQSVQTQNVHNVTLAGNTAGVLAQISSGTMTLAGGNNITLSQNGNAVTISAFNQSAQTQNVHNVTLAGNTAGVLAQISSGTMTLAGGNNVTLSQNGNAVTISAFNQTVQTQNLFDVTLAGNTAGALALISSGTATFAGGNNITLSQAGNAVTISAFNQSAQTQNCVDVTLAGNTAGALALVSSGTMTLAGGANITLSQAGNAITISGPSGASPTVNFFYNLGLGATITSNLVTAQPIFASLAVFPLLPSYLPFPGNMTINTMAMLFSQSGSTATMSSAFTSSLFFGLYTLNGSTLSLLNSVSSSFGTNAGNANQSTNIAGLRFLTIHSSLWSAQPTLSAGNYWFAWMLRTSGVSCQTVAFAGQVLFPSVSPGLSGTIGSSNNATTLGFAPLYGEFSVSTSSLPASIASADLLRQNAGDPRVPFVFFQAAGPQSY